MPQQVHEVDALIIGGGPAGLAAALCLGRARRTVVVVDADAPRHAVAEGVHNFLTREGLPPAELRAVAWEQMREFPTVRRHAGSVQALDAREGRWIATGDDGSAWSARAVLLATGVVDRHPAVRGYDALWGRSIFLCPYCHGWEVRDRPLAVLGAGEGLAHFAPLLRSWSDDVVACTDGAPLDDATRATLAAHGIAVHTALVAELEARGGVLDAIRFDDGTRLARHAIFAMATPRLPALVAALGVALDDDGWVRVDGDGATSLPGLWAAGDLTSRRHQVIEAAAQGLRACTAINRALVLASAAR